VTLRPHTNTLTQAPTHSYNILPRVTLHGFLRLIGLKLGVSVTRVSQQIGSSRDESRGRLMSAGEAKLAQFEPIL
jgi:hypothetical protein